jgi:hypothetical protein
MIILIFIKSFSYFLFQFFFCANYKIFHMKNSIYKNLIKYSKATHVKCLIFRKE